MDNVHKLNNSDSSKDTPVSEPFRFSLVARFVIFPSLPQYLNS
jgi:hypothetical protein